MFPCDKYDKTFNYKSSRRTHEKIVHGSKSPEPNANSQNSTSEEVMVGGDATLKQTKVYKVVKPRKAWFSGGVIPTTTVSQKKVTYTPLYPCDKCDQTFKCKFTRRIHKKIRHGSK